MFQFLQTNSGLDLCIQILLNVLKFNSNFPLNHIFLEFLLSYG